MAKGDQTLRAVLDHRGTPPRDKEERRYYESMMRRLGYSEAEIAKERAPEVATPAPEAPPVVAPASEVVTDTTTTRVIELEYGGAEEIPEFEPVRAKVHPTEVEQTEFDVEEQVADIEGDNEFVLLVPDEEDEPEDALLEFTEDDDELVEFTETSSEDWGTWEDEPEPALASETAPPAPPTPPAPAAPATPRGHRHGEYSLFRRELDGGQHVYFYSRKAPTDAEPAQVPEGYGVKESEESGLPYLARVE